MNTCLCSKFDLRRFDQFKVILWPGTEHSYVLGFRDIDHPGTDAAIRASIVPSPFEGWNWLRAIVGLSS